MYLNPWHLVGSDDGRFGAEPKRPSCFFIRLRIRILAQSSRSFSPGFRDWSDDNLAGIFMMGSAVYPVGINGRNGISSRA